MISSEAPSRLLSSGPLVWIGDLSYSWYLWHWPLIVFAEALWPGSGMAAMVAATFSVLPAWLSLRFVENPIRFGTRFNGRRLVAIGAVCVLVPIAAGAGLLRVKESLAANPTMRSWIRSQALHADVVRGCDSPYPLPERESTECTWRVGNPRGEIVLVGDSSAGQLTEPVVRAARRAGFNVTVATFSSCPFVGVSVLRAEALEGEKLCRRFNASTLKALVAMRPSLVITATRSDQYIEDYELRLRDGVGRLHDRPDEKARLWQAGLTRTLSALGEASIPVIVVQPVPIFPDAAQNCTGLDLIRNGCASSVSRAGTARRLERAKRAERSAASAVGATLLDLEDELCGPSNCSTARASTILYRDSEHLSVEGALRMTDRLYRVIATRARPGTDSVNTV